VRRGLDRARGREEEGNRGWGGGRSEGSYDSSPGENGMAGDGSSEDEEEDDVAGWETAAASPRRTIQIVATEAGGRRWRWLVHLPLCTACQHG
jgi:hypothetical protein